MIDRDAVPNKAWLLANAPTGSCPHRRNAKWFCIPIPNSEGWSLSLTALMRGRRALRLRCEVYWHDCKPANWLDLGDITTAGELIDWYERLSGREWSTGNEIILGDTRS